MHTIVERRGGGGAVGMADAWLCGGPSSIDQCFQYDVALPRQICQIVVRVSPSAGSSSRKVHFLKL